MIKLVAIDVDDTLLNSQGRLLQSTIEVVKKAVSRDIKVVLCSGRPLAGVKHFLNELGIVQDNQYVITFNGAVIETVTGKTLQQLGIDQTTYEKIDQYSKEHGVAYNVVAENSAIITSNLNVNRITVVQAWENSTGVLIRRPDELPKDEQIIKAVFADEKVKLDEVEANVVKTFGKENYVVRAADNFLEIMHTDVNKGVALKFLTKKLGFETNEVMAIGDERNDIPMFRVAGTSVVMANGSSEAKNQANFETASNNQDGIALAFDQFVF